MSDAVQTSVEIPDWGGPELFALVEHPVPTPGPDQVLIRTHAAGLNPVDWKVRAGMYSAAFNLGFPMVLGRDFSGTVVGAGAQVSAWSEGDEVSGTLAFTPALGAYSTHLLVTDAVLARRPDSVSPAVAAALPVAGITALQALREVAKVEPGQRVLVQAGAGGVGHVVVQLAKAMGCEVVATCSARNADFVLGLGADQAVDYNAAPFEDQVSGFDVVVDCVGDDVLARSYQVLKPGGIAVTMASRPDPAPAEALSVRAELVFMRPDAAMLAELLAMVDAGTLAVHVDHEYPLAEVATAHEVLQAAHVRGKLVLTTR